MQVNLQRVREGPQLLLTQGRLLELGFLPDSVMRLSDIYEMSIRSQALWLQKLISNSILLPQRALIVLGRSTHKQ